MTFRFVHTADWQIGRAFRGFDPKVAGLLEDARLEVIDTIAGVARAQGAAHILVAGDVFDGVLLPARTLRQPLEKMRRHSDLTWLLLPGNHDHARAGGLWDKVAALDLPVNVLPLLSPQPIEFSPGVFVLPAPLLSRQPVSDPTAWMDHAPTPEGALRIGLAHGSICNFGGATGDATIDPARAKAAGLAYLALGDWHGVKDINPRTWYSGTPEPDRFRDNEPGHVLSVLIASPDALPAVERRRTARYTWFAHDAALTSAAGLAGIEQTITAAASHDGTPRLDRLLVQLTLRGVLPAATFAGLAGWRERLDARLRALDLDVSGLTIRVERADLADLGDDAGLRTIAERLAARSKTGDDRQRAAAQAALAHLFELTRPGLEVSEAAE